MDSGNDGEKRYYGGAKNDGPSVHPNLPCEVDRSRARPRTNRDRTTIGRTLCGEHCKLISLERLDYARFVGAGDRFRTDDLVLGKHTLYQLSYTRSAKERSWKNSIKLNELRLKLR